MRFLFAFFLLLCMPALAAEEKLAVITDINNTIRESGAVTGMPEAFLRLEKQGAAFHYVSFSSTSEAEEINAFIKDHGYPAGKLHLREDNFFGGPSATKPPAIRKIFKNDAESKFILIGDSGMADPEIYGDIAREFKPRVKYIFIRNITGEKEDGRRFQDAFKDIAPAQWALFDDPAVIK